MNLDEAQAAIQKFPDLVKLIPVAPAPDLGAAVVRLREPPDRQTAIAEGISRGRSEPGPAPVYDKAKLAAKAPCPCDYLKK